MNTEEPVTDAICAVCAYQSGFHMHPSHQPTWWPDHCTVCGKEKTCTALRDYGSPPDKDIVAARKVIQENAKD